jgi:hypothetical protein
MECEASARASTDLRERDRLIDLARQWRELADKFELIEP